MILCMCGGLCIVDGAKLFDRARILRELTSDHTNLPSAQLLFPSPPPTSHVVVVSNPTSRQQVTGDKFFPTCRYLRQIGTKNI